MKYNVFITYLTYFQKSKFYIKIFIVDDNIKYTDYQNITKT